MVTKGHRRNRIRMRARMIAHFWDYVPHIRELIAMKRSSEGKYSVIKDNESLLTASRR